MSVSRQWLKLYERQLPDKADESCVPGTSVKNKFTDGAGKPLDTVTIPAWYVAGTRLAHSVPQKTPTNGRFLFNKLSFSTFNNNQLVGTASNLSGNCATSQNNVSRYLTIF